MGNLSIKFVAVVLVIGLVFWFWPASESTSPSLSAAEIITDQAEASSGAVSGDLPMASISPSSSLLNQRDSDQLLAEFNSAIRLLDQGKLDEAEQQFTQLTVKYPHFVEPHINLAAIATKKGELEQARKLLLLATKANDSTAQLFESINHVHGALAAQAYQRALESGEIEKAVVELPVTRTLTTDFELAQRVDTLESELQNQETRLANDTESSKEIANLKRTLAQERVTFSARENEFKARVSDLQVALQESQRVNQAAESEQVQIVSDSQTDRDIIAKLRIELANLENTLDGNIQELARLKSENQDLRRELATVEQVAIASNAQDPQEQVASSAPSAAQVKAAIDRVRSWALSWSNQDLDSYVSHYLPNYSTSQLSRKAWVDQRRTRLTNKRFIQVRVSDFDVAATESGYTVTFRQHYRSNTLDDTITKRLDFRVNDGQAWSSGKISAEQIIRR